MKADVGRQTLLFCKGVCHTVIVKEIRISIHPAVDSVFCAHIAASLIQDPQGSVCRLIMLLLQLEKARRREVQ